MPQKDKHAYNCRDCGVRLEHNRLRCPACTRQAEVSRKAHMKRCVGCGAETGELTKWRGFWLCNACLCPEMPVMSLTDFTSSNTHWTDTF